MKFLVISITTLCATLLVFTMGLTTVVREAKAFDIHFAATKDVLRMEGMLVRGEPPPLPPQRTEVRPAAPSQTAVWIPGHWDWNGHNYAWVSGNWTEPPFPSAVWFPGHWEGVGGGWLWVGSDWKW
jgi:hypothetical protein